MKRMGGGVDEFEPNAIRTNGYIDNFFAVVQTLLMKWVWDTIISDVFSVRNISHVEAFKFVLLVMMMRSFVDFMPN